MKKIKYILIFLVFLGFIFYGFVKISSDLPDTIRKSSNLKVTYNRSPFDLNFDTNKYIIYINNKAFSNIRDNTIDVFKTIKEKVLLKIY